MHKRHHDGRRRCTPVRWVSALLAAAAASACTNATGPGTPHRIAITQVNPSALASVQRTTDTAATRLEAARYVVAATSGKEAIRAGEAVLAEGGNAMDAALAVALDQVVLSGGAWNSLAGVGALLYYDAQSGEAHALDASFRSFTGELDPGDQLDPC